MDGGYILLIAITFTILLILAQRMEEGRKRFMRGFIVSMAILLMIRYELQLENVIGYVIALFNSFLFWLLIGRYNAVGTSDEIKVYGLDD